MPTRENYQVTSSTFEGLVRELNFILQRIADRLDKLEGIRGDSSIENDATVDDITISGNATVNDADGKVIHSLE